MAIYLINLDNLFWSNGSRLKPNKLVDLDEFYFEPTKYPTWESQEITAWIELDGEWNYAFHEGNYYFLDKVKVSHPGKAWIYSMTKDFWASWLLKGITVRGICNKTNNEKFILANLDLVASLVEDPCQLQRVNLSHDGDSWLSDMQIFEPRRSNLLFKYIQQSDWNAFYNQIRNFQMPSDKTYDSKSIVMIAALEATGDSPYKKLVYTKLQQLIQELKSGKTDYVPTKVTTLKGVVPEIASKFCLSPKGYSLGVNREYIKVNRLDFSQLVEIVPMDLTKLEFKTKEDTQSNLSFSMDSNIKMYRELKQHTYLPYFNWIHESIRANAGDALHVVNYKGRLSQYVTSRSNPDDKIFLDYIPQLNTEIDQNGVFKPTTKNFGCLGIQLFNVVKDWCGIKYDKEQPTNSIEFLVGLKRGWYETDFQFHNDLPALAFDKSRGIYNTLWTDYWRIYLKNHANKEDINTFESLPEHFKNKMITIRGVFEGGISVKKGDYLFTDLDYFWYKKDEYNPSSKFLNSNKHFGDEDPESERASADINNACVCIYDPSDQKLKLKVLKNYYYQVPLSDSDENDVGGVSFPTSKDVNARTYNTVQFTRGKTYEVKVTHLTDVERIVLNERVNNKANWISTVNQNYSYNYSELKRVLDSINALFNTAGGSSSIVDYKWRNLFHGSTYHYWEPLTSNCISTVDRLYEVIKNGNVAWYHDTDTFKWGGYGIRNQGVIGGYLSFGGALSENIGLRTPTSICIIKAQGRTYYLLSPQHDYMQESANNWQRLKGLIDLFKNNVTSNTITFTDNNASSLADTLKKPEAKSSILGSLGLLKSRKMINEAEHGFEQNELHLYDLVGTNYYAILDTYGQLHLIFKDDNDLQTNIDYHYKVDTITNEEGEPQEVHQDIVDILSQKNILRVLTADFELNDRIIWNNLDWRGRNSRPTINIKRYQPSDKNSPMENFIINFQGVRANIDVRMQFPKAVLNYQEYDPIAVESLKFELQKWQEDYKQRAEVSKKRFFREEQRLDEMRVANAAAWFRTTTNLLGSAARGLNSIATSGLAGAAAGGAAGAAVGVTGGAIISAVETVLNHGQNMGNLAFQTLQMNRDIGLRVSEIAYDRFKLDQEHHWTDQKYKFELAKISSNYVVGEVNDRDMVEQYSEMYDVDEIFLLHFTPSPVQKKIAKNWFDNYGVNCIIPDTDLKIHNGMEDGIWGFMEVTGMDNIHQDPERKLIEGILKNGIRVVKWKEELAEPRPEQRTTETWAERAGRVIQEATPEQRQIILKAIMLSLDPNIVLDYIRNKFQHEEQIVDGILKLSKDKAAVMKKIHNEIRAEEMYEILKGSELTIGEEDSEKKRTYMDRILEIEIAHNRRHVLDEFKKNPQNVADLVEASDGLVIFKEEAYTDILDAQRRCKAILDDFKPFMEMKIHDNPARILFETQTSSDYSSTYQKKDYAAVSYSPDTYTYTLFNYYPTIMIPNGGSCSWQYATIAWDNVTRVNHQSWKDYDSDDKWSTFSGNSLFDSRDLVYNPKKLGATVFANNSYVTIYSGSDSQMIGEARKGSGVLHVYWDLNEHTLKKDSSASLDSNRYKKMHTQEEWKNTMVLMTDLIEKYKPKERTD